MSESRERLLVSYVIATYNRRDDLSEAITSILDQEYDDIQIIVVSSSTDDTPELFEDGGPFDRERIEHHHFSERMGVPRARNIGFEHASGEIIATIDDDAVLANADATETMVSLFREHDDVGALAFQCRNYYIGKVNPHETPDPPGFEMTMSEEYRATNFVGVGNAIRASVLEAVGAYPSSFRYGFEEMDLSFRIHDGGYDILYTPDIVVRHKKSPEGRITDTETKERLAGNRIKLAIRNLPWRYVVVTTLLWSAYAIALTRSVSSLFNVLARIYDEREELLNDRNVVAGRTIRRIKSRKTMLFFWWYGPHPLRLFGPYGDFRRLFWETQTP
jgi:GT2 family glycosyltransferase